MNLIENFISEDLIYAIGWTMIHSLWQGLVIAFLLLVAMYLLQHKSAKLRYEIAGLSLFSLFILSICTFTLFYENISHGPIEFVLLTDATNGIGSTGVSLEYYSQCASHYFNQHLPLLVTIWLLGVAFFLLRLIGGLVFIQKLRYQKNSPLPLFWQEKMKQLLAKTPLKKEVQLLESALVNVPMVIGYLKPILLMPIGAVNNLSTSEVEAILAHELAHVVRNDYLINILFSFIEVLFYYHPAVWIISAHIRSERENCADDIAVKLCGNSLTYARALVRIEEMSTNAPIFAMPFSGQKNQLLQRIQRILKQPQNRTNILEKLTATSLILLAILFLSVSSGKGMQETILGENIHTTLTDLNNNLETALFGKEDPSLKTNIFVLTDTLPDPIKKNRKQRIVRKDDNGEIEVELVENEISQLKIDGKVIPKQDYPAYEDQVAELIENLPPPPPAPPAPPAPGTTPVGPSIKSAPPMPPAPPAPPRYRKKMKVITSDVDDNGHTVIMIEGEEEPMRIAIDGNETVFIDGQALQNGDSLIIIEKGNQSRTYTIDNNSDFDIRYTWTDEQEAEIKALQKSMENQTEEQRIASQNRMEELRQLQEEQNQITIERMDILRAEQMEEAVAEREEALAHMEEARARAEEIREEALHRIEEARAEADAQREEAIAHMEEAREEALALAEEARAQAEEARDAAAIHHKKYDPLVEQLDKEGYIKKDKHYTILFNGKRLKVNGERLPDAVHQKYVELLGKEIGQKFNIHINKY